MLLNNSVQSGSKRYLPYYLILSFRGELRHESLVGVALGNEHANRPDFLRLRSWVEFKEG